MSPQPRRLAGQVVAGLLVFAVLAMPAVTIWWAGSNGSLGDLSEIQMLGVGLAIAVGASVVAAVLMGRAQDIAATRPDVGALDPWAALFVGLIVLSLAVTLVPAVGLLVMLPDENTPLGSRVHLLSAVWVVGSLVAGLVAWWSARRVLVRGRRSASRSA